MSRLHPAASRVDLLSRQTPARYVAFDLVGIGSDDLRRRPYVERREQLERLLAVPGGPDRVELTPATRDAAVAREWFEAAGSGIDGVVAKSDVLRY